MLINYLKIAIRNLRKQAGFTLINVSGLAAGLACCLLITLYVVDELSFDRYHLKANRIYRIHSDVKFGGNDMHLAVSPDPIGPTLLQDYPEVEQYVRLHQRGTWLVKKAGSTNNLREDDITFADSTLFDVFTLPLLAGDPREALRQPNSLVLSESAARRHFGNQNPMGQTLVFDNQQAYKVTAVMRDMPLNSHFRSDFFLSMLNDTYQWGNWLSMNHHTYIVLRPDASPAQLLPKIKSMIEKYVGPQVYQALGISMDELRKSGNNIGFTLMPMTDIHLHSKQTVELAPNGDIRYVYAFAVVALFIMVIACINFMNLSTARSAKRAREVGVRKVLGSHRTQLVRQFLSESVLLAVLSMGLALILVALLMPLFNTLAGKGMVLARLLERDLLLPVLLLPIGVGLLAGVYPAFFLSSFKPISVLKGRQTAGSGSANLRAGLVVFQFIMSILLIVSTIVVYRQINFIQTKNLGFDRSQLVTIEDVYAIGQQAKAFKEEVLRIPGVQMGTMSGYLPTPSNRNDSPLFPEGKLDQNQAVSAQIWSVDYDYIKTLGMQLLQGRDFSQSFGSDSSGIILNETAVRIFGFTQPIGKRVSLLVNAQTKATKEYTVIGVVKNFHFESLRRNIGALALTLNPQPSSLTLRISGTEAPAILKQIEAQWRRFAPGQPFVYDFMSARFDAMYRAEQRIGTLAMTFAGLAILIACLGLFGLAAFMAEQRTKEIGIRKVLGATVPSLVSLLSKDFLKLVGIAILIATPLAWYAMHTWLQDFAFRTELSWWIFAGAGAVAVLIAFLTVAYQSIRAALVDPVKSLKIE